jgi:hypothetical protein
VETAGQILAALGFVDAVQWFGDSQEAPVEALESVPGSHANG